MTKTSSIFPGLNVDEVISKINEVFDPLLKKLEDSLADSVPNPDGTTQEDPQGAEFEDPRVSLVYALQQKLQEIQNSQALTPPEKYNMQIEIYKIWAEVV